MIINKRRAVVFAGALLGALGGVAATPDRSDASGAQMWGMSNLGEICISTCGPRNLCCGGGPVNET